MDETIADVLLTDGTNVQSAAREGRMVSVVSEAARAGLGSSDSISPSGFHGGLMAAGCKRPAVGHSLSRTLQHKSRRSKK